MKRLVEYLDADENGCRSHIVEVVEGEDTARRSSQSLVSLGPGFVPCG